MFLLIRASLHYLRPETLLLKSAWFPQNIWHDELHAKHFRVCSFRTDRAKTPQTANRLKQTPCRETQTASLILAPRASRHQQDHQTHLWHNNTALPAFERVSSSARAFGRSAICTESGLSCEKVRGAREAPAGISLSEDREHSLLGFSRYREIGWMWWEHGEDLWERELLIPSSPVLRLLHKSRSIDLSHKRAQLHTHTPAEWITRYYTKPGACDLLLQCNVTIARFLFYLIHFFIYL